MARTIGVNIGISLDKLKKEKFSESKGKKYLNLTTFINLDELGQYGDNGGIFHEQNKEERENRTPKDFVGNATVFFTKDIDNVSMKKNTGQNPQPALEGEDDIPF